MKQRRITLWTLARWAYRSAAIAITCVVVTANVRLHSGVSLDRNARAIGPDVLAQLEFLRGAMDQGAGERMQLLFPEGYCFMHALYGWTWVEVAKREGCDATTREKALRECRWSLERLESETGLAPFDESLDPPRGMFAVSYRAWLLGGILMVRPRDAWQERDVEVFEKECEAIAGAMQRNGPFVRSYPQQAWPCDSVVGAAVLRLHDRLLAQKYASAIEQWALKAREVSMDGSLPHRMDPGSNAEASRGSSQAIIGRFLIEADERWGEEEYERFRDRFVTSLFGLVGVREYSTPGHGMGDVDSGPLVAGISASASAAALAAANVHGDSALADALAGSAECVGMPLEWGGRKRYMLGLMPIGDAFLAWAKVSTRWTGSSAPRDYAPVVSPHWRWRVHGWSALLLALTWLPEVGLRYRGRRRTRVLPRGGE